MTVIDVHTHILSREYVDLLAQRGAPHYEVRVVASGDRAALGARVGRALQEGIGLAVGVEVLAPGGVPRSEGKAVRTVDRRPRSDGRATMWQPAIRED